MGCLCGLRRHAGERVLDFERPAKVAFPGTVVQEVTVRPDSMMVFCDWGRLPFDKLESGAKRLMRQNHYHHWDLVPSAVVMVR